MLFSDTRNNGGAYKKSLRCYSLILLKVYIHTQNHVIFPKTKRSHSGK